MGGVQSGRCTIEKPGTPYAQENESWYNGNWEHIDRSYRLYRGYASNIQQTQFHGSVVGSFSPGGGYTMNESFFNMFPMARSYAHNASLFSASNGNGIGVVFAKRGLNPSAPNSLSHSVLEPEEIFVVVRRIAGPSIQEARDALSEAYAVFYPTRN